MVNSIYTFGWNYKAWEVPFRRLKFDFLTPSMRVLEIGASRLSIVSLEFDGLVDEIIIGYYDMKEYSFLYDYLEEMKQRYSLKTKYTLTQVDAFNIDGKYDLIIMKSVLGGILRTDTSDLEMVENFLSSLIKANVQINGALVTLDNGKPFFQPLLKYFGARKNNWRYFENSDFKDADEQHVFGTFSAFSLATRLGKVGAFIDNWVLYHCDVLFDKLGSKRTIIATMYRNHSKKSKFFK